MTAVSVTAQNTRLDDAEATTDWGNNGGGPGRALETDFKYQSSNCVARKGATASRGIFLSDNVDSDLSGAGTYETVMFKFICTTPGLLDLLSVPGMRLEIGSASIPSSPSTDFHFYDVHGSDTYPVDKSWLVLPIDPNVTAHRHGTTGTPGLTVVDYYGLRYDQTAVSKSPNQALDAVDIGAGLTLVGGDGGDPDGVWQDFSDADFGTVANRYGYVREDEGIFLIYGRMIIGTATATVFTDINTVVVFPDGLFAPGFSGITVDLQNASSTVTWNDCTYQSRGITNLKRWIDSENEVDSANDEIDHTAHGYITGQAVLYSVEGGAVISGLTDNTEFFVEAVTVNAFSLHTTKQAALTSATPINITAAGAGLGEQHSFRRQPDTRATLTVTNTAGTFAANRCSFQDFRLLTFTSAVTFTGCKFVNCSSLSQTEGLLTDCIITTPLLTEGESFISTPDLDDISGCTFSMATDGGHAVERTGSATTDGFADNVFTGYWTHSNSNIGEGATFQTTSGVDGGGEDVTTDEAHGFTTGDPVYYNDNGGAVNMGLTDGNRYYVNVISTTNVSFHETKQDATTDTNRVGLTASGAEEHALYSANAMLVNNTGGAMTVNITGSGTLTSVRNIGASTTTVNVSVAIEINGLTEGSRAVMIGDGGAQDGVEILGGYANSSGIVSGTFSGTTPQNVFVKARNGGIINAAIQENFDAVFTDFTNDARDATGTDDVDLLPAAPVANDAFFFGGIAKFQRILINVTAVGSGNTITWEYSTGSDAWSSLTVTDGTSSFENSGWNTVSFTAPNDWATDTVNSQGPFFYVRARVTSVSTPVQPQAEEITLNDTVKFLPFESTGIIASGTGLTSTAVWIEDIINS